MRTLQGLAKAIERLGVLLELKGENVFKVGAHHHLARALEEFSGSLEEFVNRARVGQVKGVGKGLLEKIEQFYSGGEIEELSLLERDIPGTIFEILKLPGLGVKKLKLLYDALHIVSLEQLEQACAKGLIAQLPGFGEKTQQKILVNIRRLAAYSNLFLYSEAARQAENFATYLVRGDGSVELKIVGSLRRRNEIVRNINILVASREPQQVMRHVVAYPEVSHVLSTQETTCVVMLNSGIPAEVRVVSREQYPLALVYSTGTQGHCIALEQRASSLGLQLGETGLLSGDKLEKVSTEEEVYTRLGLGVIPPELREGRNEVEEALRYRDTGFPVLVTESDIRGVLHCHSTYSDGRNTLREMAEAIRDMGYEYFGISDHSRSARYARGLSIEQVIQQHEEIEKLNEAMAPFRVLKGIESDILKDGLLDYPDEVLKRFDFVVASVHDNFAMSEQDMTARIIRALENPYTTILGHMTGRLLLEREPYRVRIEEVLKRAGQLGKAVELNANPRRLDIDWRWIREAKNLGVKIPINPDAHSISAINDLHYGIGIARKGGLLPSDIFSDIFSETAR